MWSFPFPGFSTSGFWFWFDFFVSSQDLASRLHTSGGNCQFKVDGLGSYLLHNIVYRICRYLYGLVVQICVHCPHQKLFAKANYIVGVNLTDL